MGQNLFFYRRISYLSIAILSLFPLLALASPTPRSNVGKRDEPEECGFSGDDNTYGLGIRLGVYLQWVTSSIAYNFVPEEAVTMRGVNNCFQAAMFAGLLFITITKGPELYAVEAFIMLIFCMGGVCSGHNPTEKVTGSFEPKKYAYYRTTTFGRLIRILLGLGFCVYGVWYTFKGMDEMKHPPCSTYVFFFARVNLYNWFRTFAKIMFTAHAIGFALMIIVGFSFIVIAFWGRADTVTVPEMGLDEIGSNDSGSGCRCSPSTASDRTRGGDSKSGSGFSKLSFSGALLLFITAVELMVRWNHIQGVDSLGSTGQLLPLIIGIGGMFRVIHGLFKLVK